MTSIFLEIWFADASLEEAGIEGRDELEDPLDEALQEAGFGKVTGGGGGERGSNIDVEIRAEQNFEAALALIRNVLRDNSAPPDTLITLYEPEEVVYTLNEGYAS